MIRFKSHNQHGFTFIELLLALFMIATLLAAVLRMQQMTVAHMGEYSGRLRRMLLAEYRLFELAIDQLKGVDSKDTVLIKHPETKLESRIEQPSKQSNLHAYAEQLDMVGVTARWGQDPRKKEFELVTMRAVEEEDE